jgi:hypothetical protein
MCIFLRVIPKENKTLPPSVVVPQNTKRKKLKTKPPPTGPQSSALPAGPAVGTLYLGSVRGRKAQCGMEKDEAEKEWRPEAKARIGRETVMNQ